MNDQDYALLVGINHYPGIGDLAGAERDATEFAAWLNRPDGGGVRNKNITRLVTSDFHPPYPAEPGLALPNVPLFDTRLISLVMNPKTGERHPRRRRLYIFLSGHGFVGRATGNEAALYTANASSPSYPHIAATQYATWVKTTDVYQEIVLIMDCCRKMSQSRLVVSPSFDPMTNGNAAAKVRLIEWYSVPLGANAKEAPSDDGQVRGVFSRLLIEALDNAAADASGSVMASVVADYIQSRWGDVAPGKEPPDLRVDRARDIVLATRSLSRAATVARGIPVTFSLDPPASGSELVVSGGPSDPVRLPVNGENPTCELLPGLYKVQVDGTDRTGLFEVKGDETLVSV